MDLTYYDAKLDDTIKSTYNVNESYEDLLAEMKEYIMADCFAVKVNDNVIFNTNMELTIRERILEQMIRNTIIESPHQYIICNLLRNKIDFIIEIYMFSMYPWKLVIKYNNNSTFYVYKKVSQQYMDKFN